MVTTMAELSAYLAEVQSVRANDVRCELTAALSARTSDAALKEALLLGLPMAQGVKHRILHSRGRGVILTAKVHYREGVRMLSGDGLTREETAALEMARDIVNDALGLKEAARFQWVYAWVCRNIRYAHTAPGQKGYERLVGASGVLADRQANCQGFADVLYLLCGLCGISCEYRMGRGERRLHVWNAVCIDGVWREADVSKGARQFDNSPTNFQHPKKNTTQDAKNMLYLNSMR